MKFAHLADIHLGFQKNETLQKLEQDIFEEILDQCISRKVDFILIPGDMFHANIPEMRVQKYAFSKFRQIHDAGIPVYVVYGSHDFSPVSNSVIDLLEEIGYIKKVIKSRDVSDERITLDFITDKKTGVKIAGLSGLKAGKDIIHYEKLDRNALESESGFKIFLFHGGITEMKTGGVEGDYMPLSLLPKGFNYYAGGHIHKFSHQKYDDYPNVVYPGTPFAGYYNDLEDSARGQKRGFVLVEFEETIKNIELVELKNVNYKIIDVNADARNAESVNQEIIENITKIEPAGKIIIIKVQGELSVGKTTDIDFTAIREKLMDKGALEVKISRSRLTSREYKITSASGKNKVEIETNIFAENIGEIIAKQKEITGDSGVSLAKKLLKDLAQPPLKNEKTLEYNGRITQHALEILGLNIDDS